MLLGLKLCRLLFHGLAPVATGAPLEQQAAELEAQKHHIASIYTNQSPTALFPTNGDSVAKQFMLRWIF